MDMRQVTTPTGAPLPASLHPLAAIKAAALAADAYARTLRSENRFDATESVYTTLHLTLHTILIADPNLRGWQRAALLLTDLQSLIPLDAIVPSRLDSLELRAVTLMDLPDLATVHSMEEIHHVLAAAINVGAPRYNASNIAGCAAIYWATAHSLLAAPAVRGITNHAKAMGQLRTVVEREFSDYPASTQDVDAFAWALRHAFDAVLAMPV